MSVATAALSPSVTDHALLVPLGHFASRIGLLAALERVPFPMKTVAHRPGEKLAELEAHILAGGMHICELEASAHPLVQDPLVAQAWGQAAFASASGVSALLHAATTDSVAVLKTELRQVIAPYRQRLLRDRERPEGLPGVELGAQRAVEPFDLPGRGR